MTVTDEANAVNRILDGLVAENTPKSDAYIQAAVASTLDYVSQLLPTVFV